MSKQDYLNKCFSPNWLEVDLSESEFNTIDSTEKGAIDKTVEFRSVHNKEERLEGQRRKDLNTLLKELEEIKQNVERAVEKQRRLTNLMGFYTGEFSQ
jgi:hypothetical protein